MPHQWSTIEYLDSFYVKSLRDDGKWDWAKSTVDLCSCCGVIRLGPTGSPGGYVYTYHPGNTQDEPNCLLVPTILPRAVCIVLCNQNGEYLSVSRKDNPDLLGLPGGKVEFYENDEFAIVRETFEETGLQVDPDSLRQIYQGPCKPIKPGGVMYDVATFSGNWSGTIKTSEEGIVTWVPPYKLVEPNAPFREYNWEVYKRLGVVP